MPIRIGDHQAVDDRAFSTLLEFLRRVPAIKWVSHGDDGDGLWWVKFGIDIHHPLAWQVVQEFGHVANELSFVERLPTRFFPVSPPPYLNGGPDEYLSWVLESTNPEFRPGTCAKWLEGRLPNPVDDPSAWSPAAGE
jgi:hypothetical protein